MQSKDEKNSLWFEAWGKRRWCEFFSNKGKGRQESEKQKTKKDDLIFFFYKGDLPLLSSKQNKSAYKQQLDNYQFHFSMITKCQLYSLKHLRGNGIENTRVHKTMHNKC